MFVAILVILPLQLFGQFGPRFFDPAEDPTARWFREKNEKDQLEQRLHQIESANYEYRNPTSAEVESMQKKWRDENPLLYSGRMPDFSKKQIRVNKADKKSAAARAEVAELNARIAALENRIAHPQAQLNTDALQQNPNSHIKKEVVRPIKPVTPNPASITMRKLSDGRVRAIIGDKKMQFETEAEAQAYVDKMKQTTNP